MRVPVCGEEVGNTDGRRDIGGFCIEYTHRRGGPPPSTGFPLCEGETSEGEEYICCTRKHKIPMQVVPDNGGVGGSTYCASFYIAAASTTHIHDLGQEGHVQPHSPRSVPPPPQM